jgi:hypothetical protein
MIGTGAVQSTNPTIKIEPSPADNVIKNELHPQGRCSISKDRLLVLTSTIMFVNNRRANNIVE